MARKEVTLYQYPYPNEPKNWTQEERMYGQGLRRLFDILFSRKLQNVLIADNAINSRTIADKAVEIRHTADGFGSVLDISENETITTMAGDIQTAQNTADGAVTAAGNAQSTADGAVTAAENAQSTANGIPNLLYPVGATVIMASAPSFGTWTQTEISGLTAWTRTE